MQEKEPGMDITSILKCVKCGTGMEGLKCPKCGYAPEIMDGGILNFMDTIGAGLISNKQISDSAKDTGVNDMGRLIGGLAVKYLNDKKGLFLDIGSGPGFFSRFIMSRVPGTRFIGLDIHPSFIPSEINENFTYVQADFFKNPFKDGSFDGIVNFDVIEHIQDDRLFVKEMIDLLKKDGVFIIGTPNRNRLTAIISDIIHGKKKFPYSYGKDPVVGEVLHIREYSRSDIDALFSGFKDQIEYSIKPIFLGFRGRMKNFGINEPVFFKNYAVYWLVTGKKIS
jgi:SAM-dependent methyltransferase